MTTIVNLPLNKKYKRAYAIHNFKEIDNTVLMIMYVEQLHSWKKIFFNYEQGYWHTDQYKEYIDAKTSSSLQKELFSIFYAHNIKSGTPKKTKITTSTDHVLLLNNACN